MTLERALRFGYTVGCRCCENIAEGAKHADACHERFRLLIENEELAKKARAAERAKGSATPKTPSFDAPATPSFEAPPARGARSSKDPAPVPGASNAVSSAATNSSGKQAEATEEHELDYWEFDKDKLGWKRVHIKPLKGYTHQSVVHAHSTPLKFLHQGKRSGSVEAVFPTLQIVGMPRALTVESRLEAGLELLGFSPKVRSTLQKRLFDTFKANASEQLKRSPVKGASAVASILQALEAECPETKAAVAQTAQAFKNEPDKTVKSNHTLRQYGSEALFEFSVTRTLLWGKSTPNTESTISG